MNSGIIGIAGALSNTLPPSTYPGALSTLRFEDIDRFIRFCRHLKPEIELNMVQFDLGPPGRLPAYIYDFLSDVLKLSQTVILRCWEALRYLVWTDGPSHLLDDEARLFQQSSIMFYPPVRHCTKCQSLLKLPSRVPIVFFSKHGGARAGYSTSLSCPVCKIRYYHNYYTEDKAQCYYGGLPDVIQIEDHAFLETTLCELFTTLTLLAWVSSQNCAHIFNDALVGEEVLRGFFLNALLRDRAERGEYLSVPNGGGHDARLQYAMELRNNRIIKEGQPAHMHACKVCERSFHAVVTDGISIGHPCCKMHNCTKPLVNNRHHYCIDHQSEATICCINNCRSKARPGHRTCNNNNHAKLEEERKAQDTAFFQLRRHLERAKISQPVNSMPTDEDDNSSGDDDDADDADPGVKKSSNGNRKFKAQFSRRRTHNEQLVVCCCGVIAARGTMFGAESISGVKDFLKSVYPDPSELPDVLNYDSMCQFQQHLKAQKDTYFRQVIMPVDVFHFKSKHKVTDKFCQKHCNPALWPELRDGDGKWLFNSSAAEQANAWMGGYLAMVRDMLAYRFEFFLDKLIKRRNERLIARLDEQGKVPYIIPTGSNIHVQ
ncbi:hypothetical protein OF83DRAFT_1069232 [Amylostereum chailletii]|nr:hypothetical protein OF83DRAFT_1069232 [Amylostereum chailletii]